MSDQPLRGPMSRLTRDGQRLPWLLRSPLIAFALLVVAAVLPSQARLPVTPTTPSGLELELPGTADGALGVLRAFDDAGVLHSAVVAIRWDFLLIVCYSIGFATLLEWLKARDPDHADALIGYAAWGWLFAGVLDCLENGAMLVVLSAYPTASPSPLFGVAALLGTLVSLTKWTLICAALGYTAWEVLKAAGRALFLPMPGDDLVPAPAPAGSGGGGSERSPRQEPLPLSAFKRIQRLFDVLGRPEPEAEPAKPAPKGVDTP